jgi:hypothetical protein
VLTNTPTRTPTPTRTATPTFTATPLPCAAAGITVDGSLAEWSTKFSQTVTVGNARYLYPAATPSAADLSGKVWVACNVGYLSIAGIMTDTQVYNPTGDIANGDSMEIIIDARNDGIYRPRQDDHDLFISPDGQLLDRDFQYPLVATVVAVVTPGSNWRYEANIPITQIWPQLVTGSRIRVTMGLYDQDANVTTPTPGVPAGPSQVMIGPPLVWTLHTGESIEEGVNEPPEEIEYLP